VSGARGHVGWFIATILVTACATVANVAVAWACVVWSPMHRPKLGTSMTSAEMRAKYGETERPYYFEWLAYGFGVDHVHIGGDLDHYQHGTSILRAGWPFRAFRATWTPPGTVAFAGGPPKGWTEAASIGPFAMASEDAASWRRGLPLLERYRLPVQPIAAGFLRDELAYSAAIAAGMFGRRWARGLFWRLQGRCRGCGYPATGVRCPECGRARPLRAATVGTRARSSSARPVRGPILASRRVHLECAA
jgi:hypothetical protein